MPSYVTSFTGSAVLVAGSATVSNTTLADTDIVVYERSTLGGTPGHLSYAITAGTSLVFTSSSSSDTSTITYTVLSLVTVLPPQTPLAPPVHG